MLGGAGTYEASNANLCSRVAELRKGSMEQAVLFPERFDVGICVCFRSLERHVCVSYLRDRRAGSTDQ